MSNTADMSAPMSLGSNIVVPAATSGDPSSGVDLVNVQITQAAPFPASLLETMSTEADPTVLANLLQRYTLCVARISTALISPHLHQRPLVQSHVDKLEALYGDLGPDLTEVSNYGYVVATDPRWIQYSHNSRDYITVHEGSRMTVDCLRGGHRIAAVNQWAEHHELPEFRYWVVYVLRPEFNGINPVLQANFVLQDNAAQVQLLTSEADLFLHFVGHVGAIYARQTGSVIGLLATNHGVAKGDLANLIRHPKVIEALGRLAPLTRFFPQWYNDLTLFQHHLAGIRSEYVQIKVIDMIVDNLTAVKSAAGAAWMTSFSLAPLPVEYVRTKSQKDALAKFLATGYTLPINDTHDLTAQKALKSWYDDNGNAPTNAFGIRFMAPTMISKNTPFRHWITGQVVLRHAIAYFLNGAKAYRHAHRTGSKINQWPIDPADHVEGLIEIFLHREGKFDELETVLNETGDQLRSDWTAIMVPLAFNRLAAPWNIPVNEQPPNQMVYAKYVEKHLLSKSEAWYQFALAMDIEPEKELLCSISIDSSQTTRALLPKYSPLQTIENTRAAAAVSAKRKEQETELLEKERKIIEAEEKAKDAVEKKRKEALQTATTAKTQLASVTKVHADAATAKQKAETALVAQTAKETQMQKDREALAKSVADLDAEALAAKTELDRVKALTQPDILGVLKTLDSEAKVVDNRIAALRAVTALQLETLKTLPIVLDDEETKQVQRDAEAVLGAPSQSLPLPRPTALLSSDPDVMDVDAYAMDSADLVLPAHVRAANIDLPSLLHLIDAFRTLPKLAQTELLQSTRLPALLKAESRSLAATYTDSETEELKAVPTGPHVSPLRKSSKRRRNRLTVEIPIRNTQGSPAGSASESSPLSSGGPVPSSSPIALASIVTAKKAKAKSGVQGLDVALGSAFASNAKGKGREKVQGVRSSKRRRRQPPSEEEEEQEEQE